MSRFEEIAPLFPPPEGGRDYVFIHYQDLKGHHRRLGIRPGETMYLPHGVRKLFDYADVWIKEYERWERFPGYVTVPSWLALGWYPTENIAITIHDPAYGLKENTEGEEWKL